MRALRTKAGLSQARLAEASGLSRSSIYQFETGEVNPAMDTLGRLLTALDATLVDLANEMRGDAGERCAGGVDDEEIVAGEPTYRLFGREIAREDLERRLDAALDRFVRDALEADPAARPEELRERRRRQLKPAGVRDD